MRQNLILYQCNHHRFEKRPSVLNSPAIPVGPVKSRSVRAWFSLLSLLSDLAYACSVTAFNLVLPARFIK